ncbi:hypothetical protein [Ureibacillus acetophenoni]|uniref:Uncharacterized protein n=1 Tax=Ureibacillus acetophenoni TaxID=614649 RepID=A0A285UGY8_9BACL|nr:hypothetical protein [Ureibacillus acetophenoni]SOC40937.1 hypothetical protein SAMN05877842_10936 [Ureibacillus acetophenoni]
MGYYQLFILGSLLVITITVFIQSRIAKRKISSMEGMMISMYFSMNLSLTVGVLLGVTYQGDLYLSTMLSIFIGIFVGLLCGSNFGILSVLDGVMAGIMGGMMGAMLGEMIRQDQGVTLVRIFLFLSISTIFLFKIISKETNSKYWFVTPLVLTILISFYFIGGVSYAEKHFPVSNDSQHPMGQTSLK